MKRTLSVAMVLLGASGAALAQAAVGTRAPEDQSAATAAATRINASETALEKGDFTAAERLLRELAHENPKDARILYDLGFAQEHNNEPTEAAESYAASSKADPAFVQPRLALGLLEARSNHPDAARSALSAVTTNGTAPADLRGRALRALARLDATNDPAKASDELLRAIQLTGQTPEDAALTAELANRSGNAPAAETAFRKALAEDPANLDASLGLARALRKQGKTAEAEQVLQAAKTAHPEAPPVAAELADLYATEGKTTEAIALIESLRAGSPQAASSAPLTAMLARLYAAAGRFVDAEPLYRALVAQTPTDPLLLDALGGVLLRQAKYAESERVLMQAYKLRPAFHDDQAWAESATHLALAAQRNHDPATALQALDARATVLPDSPASLFLQATAHDALHHNKHAEQLYRAFLAKAGGNFPDEEFEARHRLIALDHER